MDREIKVSARRQQLVKQAKEIYQRHLGKTTAADFFYLQGLVANDEQKHQVPHFHMRTLYDTSHLVADFDTQFVTSLIPNNLSGSLMTAHVLVLNLNMGAGRSEIECCDTNKHCQHKYSPTATQYTKLNDHKAYSLSQTIFHEAFRNNHKMRQTLLKIMDSAYSIKKARKLYQIICADLQIIYTNKLNLKSADNDYSKLRKSLKKYDLKSSPKHVQTLSNFYRQAVLPLLQLKFPFELKLNFAPISIASEPYYVPIDRQLGDAKTFQLDPSQYNWNNHTGKDEHGNVIEGDDAWTNYVFSNQTLRFQPGQVSLLEKLQIKHVSEIMLLQQYPYASSSFNRAHNDNVFKPWQAFVQELLIAIDDYNQACPDDQIQIIRNRKGTDYLTLDALTHTSIWVRKVAKTGLNGRLIAQNFAKYHANRD